MNVDPILTKLLELKFAPIVFSMKKSTLKQCRLIFLVLVSGINISACVEVRAWEKGYLAKNEMAWQADLLEDALAKHIFFSKEASSGSSNAAGGGCGCN